MPLFKGQGCKGTPNKAINYITDKNKAEIITTNALDNERSYSDQFKETAKLYNKSDKFDERKYYHFKLSCNQADNVTPKISHELAEDMVKKFFSNYECVIATHTDTNTVHSHIIVNAINFETGNKFHCNNKQYAEMKDAINEIGIEKGLSVLNWRQPSQDRITTPEKRIQLKGGTSWKEELKEVITEAMLNSNNFDEFVKHLKKYRVSIERNTEKTISFRHPDKQKPIRGDKLGQSFTKGAILDGINQHRNRNTSTEQNRIISTTPTTSRDERKSFREQSAKTIVDGVQRKVRAITEGIEEYTPGGKDRIRERNERDREEQRIRQEREQREVERMAEYNRPAKRNQPNTRQQYQQRNQDFDFER